jgi:ABC-type Fe3+-siderophore transport system permease subunit
MEKPWYASKTLWANSLAIVGAVVQGVTGNEIISPEIQITVMGVINMILRFFTNAKLG